MSVQRSNSEHPVRLSYYALEPRIAFDAAIPATVADHANAPAPPADVPDTSHITQDSDDLTAAISSVGPAAALSERHEIVFIDPTVPDIATLLAGISSNAEIVVFDPTRDGIAQMAEALSGRSGINAIHILSHGGEANLQLGTGDLNARTISSLYANDLRMIGQSLSADADILIYGCNFAGSDAGVDVAQMLADLTGADIAASNDMTGHQSLHGDWTLEVATGAIETHVPITTAAQDAWRNVLPTVTFEEGTGGYSGTHDTYLNQASPNTNFGGSTILVVDDASGSNEQQILIKFDNIFGNGPGQIPYGSTITSATLQFYVSHTDALDAVEIYQMHSSWDESSTWNSLSGGVSLNGVEAGFVPLAVLGTGGSGSQQFTGLASSVQAWSDGTANNGWVIATALSSADDWNVYSSEHPTVGARPILSVTYTAPPSPPVVSNLAGDNLAYDEGDGAVVIEQGGDVTVTDSDTADFGGGSLTVSFAAGSDSAEDVLAIRNQGTGAGQIGLSGSNVTYGGVTIGTFTGGSSGANLVISFNGNATPAAAEALMQNVTFQNTDNAAPTEGARTVRFVINDGDGAVSANYDTTVTVSAVNDAPTISNLSGDSLAYTENDGARVIEQGANASVSDVDSLNFAGGSLTVRLSAGGVSSEDVLSIRNQGTGAGQIGISGANVTYGGVTIGTYVGGSAGADIVISLNGSATPTATQALVRNITFENTDTVTPTAGARTVRYTLSDGDGGTSANYDATVVVSSVDDPPLISGLGGDSSSYNEGDGPVVIEQGGNVTITDTDSANFSGGSLTVSFVAGSDSAEDVLAIRNQGAGAGQIGISGSNVTYGGVTIGSYGGGSAGANLVITLNSNATPAAVEALVQNITFENIDSNSPTNGARTIRYVLADGDGATSANYDATISVSAVNDAPTLDTSRTPALASQNEDAGIPVGAVGTLVSSLVDFASSAGQVNNVTDPDAGSLLGIAVIAVDTANGNWFYSTDNGASWIAVGSVTDSNARLLAADANTRIYFQSAADYNGTMANAIMFRAWDRSNGVNGGLADASINGGGTAFSAAADAAVITINAVNDAPSLANGATATLPATLENVASSGTTVAAILASTSGIDADGGAMNGIAVTGATGSGTWQYSTDGVTWTDFGSATPTNALLVDGATQVRYVPSAAAETATISFVAWDGSTGTASTNSVANYANPGAGGGASSFSSESASASMIVAKAIVPGGTAFVPPPGSILPILVRDPLALAAEELRSAGVSQARPPSLPIIATLASGYVPQAKEKENAEESAPNALLAPPVSPNPPDLNLLPYTTAPTIPGPPAGAVEFALSDFDRDAFREALNRELDEIQDPDGVTHAVLMQVLSGSSVALTAGVVGWMLRGGALASALLSSMPVLRGFDPLMVAMQPTRRKQEQSDSLVDRIFESASIGGNRNAAGVR